MKTDKELTYNAVNGYYLNTQTMRINKGYLNDAIQLWGANTRKFVEDVRHTNRKITSIVWQMFLDLVDDHIKDFELPYPQYHVCTSEQLKSWLNEYGEGYETLKPTVDYFENMRKDEKGE